MLAAVLFLKLPVQAVSAEKALVMDQAGNRIVYEKNIKDRSLIASTTKIMTGLLAAENCNVLEPVRIPKEAVGIEGSSTLQFSAASRPVIIFVVLAIRLRSFMFFS